MKKRLDARNQLADAVLVYCNVFFEDYAEEYNERFVAGVMAFIQTNYYRELYLPVLGVEMSEERLGLIDRIKKFFGSEEAVKE